VDQPKPDVTFERLLLGLLVFPIAVFVRGMVLAMLWGWFVVPTLHAPPVSWAGAAGLSFVGTLFFGTGDDGKKSFLKHMLSAISAAIVALGLGYALHLFL